MTSTFTYDPTTDVGRMRRTMPDKDEDDAFWSDEELQSFLNDEGDWRSATALALETIASDSAMVMQFMRIENVEVDGSKTASVLMERASILREQAIQNESGAFDVIEMITNDFGYREAISR